MRRNRIGPAKLGMAQVSGLGTASNPHESVGLFLDKPIET
jgi:hypothetical protein